MFMIYDLGHNIQRLKCEYSASLPSLEVHLRAIDCNDLYYPNPPKPVVTSCGVVVLLHDYSARLVDGYLPSVLYLFTL